MLLTRLQPFALTLLRVMTALLLLQHGTQKLFSFPSERPGGPAALFSLSGLAGVLEFAGSALLLVGLFTRPVAFVLSGLMAVAYFMAHAPKDFYPVINGGELAVLYCFVFFYFVFAGGGPISLDALRGRTP